MVKANTMDRGTDAMKTHLSGCDMLQLRQTRRGWLQECCGCEAKTEFKYFIGDQQVFHSLEDSGCCVRYWCTGCHPYTMTVKELNTQNEIVTVDRPLRCCMCNCKCCCYQEATVTSKGETLGSIKETFYWCVPAFNVMDPSGSQLYYVHPPTCLGGLCVNCCAEGNPCGKGCCKSSLRVYAPGAASGGDAPYLGMVLKKPKSALTEVFTDAVALECQFPKDASASEKGLLTGMTVFLNSLFYEGNDE